MTQQLQTTVLDAYVVAHVGGGYELFNDGNAFDEFGLVHNGVNLCTLTVTYEGDNQNFAVHLTKHKADLNVPIVAGDFHLVAAIMNTVMHHFTSDHEFYCDAFVDEDGKAIRHPLIVAV